MFFLLFFRFVFSLLAFVCMCVNACVCASSLVVSPELQSVLKEEITYDMYTSKYWEYIII